MSCQSLIATEFVEGDTGSLLTIPILVWDAIQKRFVRKNLTGKTVTLFYRYVGADPWEQRSMNILDPSELGAQYQWQAGELVKGTIEFRAKVTDEGGKVVSTNTSGYVDVLGW